MDWRAHEWLKGNLKQDNRSDSLVYDAWLYAGMTNYDAWHMQDNK